MLDNNLQENLKYRFQESVNQLDRVIKKAQLIRKIEQKTRESKNSSPEELIQIMRDMLDYEEQIRLLDEALFRR